MRKMFLLALAIASFLVSSQLALPQDCGRDMNMSGPTPSMPGMAEGEMGHRPMSMTSHSLIAPLLPHAPSGPDA